MKEMNWGRESLRQTQKDQTRGFPSSPGDRMVIKIIRVVVMDADCPGLTGVDDGVDT